MPIGKYSKKQGREFIKLAKEIIESEFNDKKVEIPDKLGFRQARGVFITLTKNKNLRGCVGFPHASYALGDAIVKAAKLAAFHDSRFSPLNKEELKDIKIEVSILTEPSEIRDIAKEFNMGEDGLICNYLGYSGLLLPQVAIEHKMNKIDFLEAVCGKAGLPKNFWQNDNIKFHKFQVQLFREE